MTILPRLIALAALSAASASAWGQGLGGSVDSMADQVRIPDFDRVTAPMARTWIKLQRRVDVPFGAESLLGDVLKFFKQATSDEEMPGGLTLLIRPGDLEEHKLSLSSTVSLELKDVPIATSLRLLLRQIGQDFFVQEDGIVMIRALQCDDGESIHPELSEAAARTWLSLCQPLDFPFESETTLKEVVMYFRTATAAQSRGNGERPRELPIYFDPFGLTEKEITMDSKVKLKLEGYPFKTGLTLCLDQLGLKFTVKDDGVLVIGSEGWIPREAIDRQRDIQTGHWESKVFDLQTEVQKLREELASLRRLDVNVRAEIIPAKRVDAPPNSGIPTATKPR